MLHFRLAFFLASLLRKERNAGVDWTKEKGWYTGKKLSIRFFFLLKRAFEQSYFVRWNGWEYGFVETTGWKV